MSAERIKRDVKEIVGVLMRVLDGGEVSHEQLAETTFEADGELQEALNEAHIKLMEFSYDRESRLSDHAVDRKMRSALQECLDKIVSVCDREDALRIERSETRPDNSGP